jgi:hypothetical protein
MRMVGRRVCKLQWRSFSGDQIDFRGRIKLYSYYHTYLPSYCMGMDLATLFHRVRTRSLYPSLISYRPPMNNPTETPIANHPHYRLWNRSRDVDVKICRCESSPKSMESEDN